MKLLTSFAVLGLGVCVAQDVDVVPEFSVPSTEPFVFAETFQGPFTWVKSEDSKYANQPVKVSATASVPKPFDEDKSLLLEKANFHYGLSQSFEDALDVTDKTLVVQYEVRLTEGLTCGGAYIKLLKHEDGMELSKVNNDSPYVIMFGPDACGDTNKVHFIFRHKNPVSGEWEEKHAQNTPAPKKDRASHVYTLIVRPDNTYEILIDMESSAKGSLLEDFKPPVNPSKMIDDPTDSKPEDWVDVKKIRDPEAVKPDDWDEDAPRKIPDPDAVMPSDWLVDEPAFVDDPEASQPEDWDEEEDGEWEAPVVANPKCKSVSGCGSWKRPEIENPAYKGKWTAPLIDNPAYQGEWKARQIENPHFFEDNEPHNLATIGALAVEIWTTNGGIRMDNFLVGFDEAAAKAFAAATWKPRKEAEDKADKAKGRDQARKQREQLKAEGGFLNLAQAYAGDVADLAVDNPVPAVTTLIALITAFVVLCGGSSTKKPSKKPSQQAAPREAAPQNAAEASSQAAADSSEGGATEKKTKGKGAGASSEGQSKSEAASSPSRSSSGGSRRRVKKA